MATVATKDRRVTVPTLGFITDFVDGSRLFWASLSPVHERSGYRVSHPDRIQGDAVISAFVHHGPVQVCGSPPFVLQPIVLPLQSRAVLAAVKAWPGNGGACRAVTATANLDGGCARRETLHARSGRRNGSRSNKETNPSTSVITEFAAMS